MNSRTSRARLLALNFLKRLIAWKISCLKMGNPSPIQLWNAEETDSPLESFSILQLKLFPCIPSSPSSPSSFPDELRLQRLRPNWVKEREDQQPAPPTLWAMAPIILRFRITVKNSILEENQIKVQSSAQVFMGNVQTLTPLWIWIILKGQGEAEESVIART